MRTEKRGRITNLLWRSAHLHRKSEHLDWPLYRMLDLHYHIPGLRLLAGESFRVIVDRRSRNADRKHEITIRRCHNLIGSAHSIGAADRNRHLLCAPVFRCLPDRESKCRLKKRSINILPRARMLSTDDRTQDRVNCEETGAKISDRNAAFDGRKIRITSPAHHARHRLRDQIESGPPGPRPGLTETRNACIDEPWIDPPQSRIVDLETRRDARSVVLD